VTAPLPPCPLCEAEPEHGVFQFPGGNVWCLREGCPLYCVQIPEAAWRRLASPALAPSAAADCNECGTRKAKVCYRCSQREAKESAEQAAFDARHDERERY
jgi:hypothetical protein